MNITQIVNIYTGEIITPAVVDGKKFFTHSEITKSGAPDRRSRGSTIGIWSGYETPTKSFDLNGRYVPLDSTIEADGSALRAVVNELESKLENAKLALAIYYFRNQTKLS